MLLEPIYTPDNTTSVHSLFLGWAGHLLKSPDSNQLDQAIKACLPAWEKDGFTHLSSRQEGNTIQVLCRTEPHVSPKLFGGRIKGRLQHAAHQLGQPVKFQRNLSVRSVGRNTRTTVEAYIDKQADKSDYVDPKFKGYLGEFTLCHPDTHLEEASASVRGQYWYNIHLVITVADRRVPVTQNENFRKLRDTCGRIAKKKGYILSRFSIMPDHIHLALRGIPAHSPEDIALGYLNNLSYVMGFNRCWSSEYYVGTFSEYTLGGLKKKAAPLEL